MFLSGLFSLQNKSHLKYLVEFEERSGNIKTKDSSDLNAFSSEEWAKIAEGAGRSF